MTRFALLLFLAALLPACDTLQPETAGRLVVEMYVQPDRPAPVLRLHRTAPFGEPMKGVSGAVASLTTGGRLIEYAETDTAGVYRSETVGVLMHAHDRFRLSIRAEQDVVDVEGFIPPPVLEPLISIDVPERAVRAVLLDSLSLPLDSLRLSLPSQTGYLFPVVATLSWKAPADDPVGQWWVETRLAPLHPFSSTLIDYFLRPQGLSEEDVLTPDSLGRLRWTGVYAVPVAHADDPFPPHDLRAVIIRGSPQWAAYASSNGDPDHREPVFNVPGALGMVAGLSVDTLRISLR